MYFTKAINLRLRVLPEDTKTRKMFPRFDDLNRDFKRISSPVL